LPRTRNHIGRRGPLAAEERAPAVFEIRKTCRDVYRGHLDRPEARAGEEHDERVRDEIQHQPRGGCIDDAVIERRVVCSGAAKLDAPRKAHPGAGEKGVGRMDAHHGCRGAALEDCGAEGAGSTPDIQPALRGGHAKPGQESWRDKATSAAHVLLIGIPALP
jgi:hypothetical protein